MFRKDVVEKMARQMAARAVVAILGLPEVDPKDPERPNLSEISVANVIAAKMAREQVAALMPGVLDPDEVERFESIGAALAQDENAQMAVKVNALRCAAPGKQEVDILEWHRALVWGDAVENSGTAN